MTTRPDTTRRRKANSMRVLRVLDGLFSGLPAGLALFHHVVPLWSGDINDVGDIQAARLAALTIWENAGRPPARVKMERGRAGGLHLHIITPVARLPGVRGGHVRPVYGLPGLAAYLEKPNDSRLARLKPADLGRYTRSELRVQHIQALQEAADSRAARGGRRCPARVWTLAGSPEWIRAQLSRLVGVAVGVAVSVALAASLRVVGLLSRPGAFTRPTIRPPVHSVSVRRGRHEWGRWSACVCPSVSFFS